MKKKNKLKKTMRVTMVVLLLLIIAFFLLWSVTFNNKLTVCEGGVTRVYVNRGTEFASFVNDLSSDSIISGRNSMLIAGHILGFNDDDILTPGCYPVYPSMTNSQFLQRVKRGEQVPVRLTIGFMRLPEQFAAKVSKQMMVDSAEIMNFVSSEDKMAALGFKPEHLFALVVRNTYEVWWTASIESIMQRLKRENDAFWNEDRLKKAEALGLSVPEVVTLASIVESETNHQPEKSRIAGLYLNRLRSGIKLQSDPTVLFALKDFKVNRVLYEHLKVDSPYNTYKYAGLPPGPIRLPSVATIDAVLNAEKNNYIYMCANENFNGTHNFARTLSEHNRNAAKYHAALRKWMREKKNK